VKIGYACALSKYMSRAFYYLLLLLFTFCEYLLTVRGRKNSFGSFLQMF